jgi:hypothetical protein
VKFKQVGFYYQNKSGDNRMYLNVYINQAGVFYVRQQEIPHIIREKLATEFEFKSNELMAESFDSLNNQIKNLISRYEEIIQTETSTKVIVYDILIQGNTGRKQHHDLATHDGVDIGFGIKWFVGYRFKRAGKVRYTYENGTETRVYDMKVIDYSEQREAWFKNLDASLTELIIKVHKFLNVPSAKKFAEYIDSGVPMLAAPINNNELAKKQ